MPSDPCSKKRGRPVDQTRAQAILQVASQLFMQQGFEHTSMDDIAHQAKVSKLTLYNRFPHKYALFCEVIQSKCQEYVPCGLFSNFDTLPIQQAMHALGVGMLSLITSDDAISIYRMMGAAAKSDPLLPKTFYQTGPQRMREIIIEKFQQLHHKGILKIDNPAQAKDLWGSLLIGSDLYMQTFLGLRSRPTPAEISACAQRATEVFLKIYGR